MSAVFNPDFWNSLGAPAIAVIVAVVFVIALTKGWLVPGSYHREMLNTKDRELAARDKQIEKLQERGSEDSKTIALLAKSDSEKTATENATTRILAAIRETITTGGGGG